ncbi:hypothetical protein TGME49_252410 [Toxoplasma gondii ME49]|uniref:Uncharacterized protein n=2 Tax=Toxoplasma gondii TaxID=5811 RepID=S8GTH6_TOXGM|nr:hypothetical protein TGME49_252410 [Toxoplasma gondii ME49]EPT31864.1 hypothetical protein TGME49_252410 [Toxoplasma gondii ME49]KYF41806.1 hypothetical protein TGARI_252410 [Toxoplasma gondii ARI]|eukprot:XP_002369349.1 hypothetical protein TGME49_252410 [Toxoplasma gondii ME49]
MRIDALRLRARFRKKRLYTHGGFRGSRVSGNERPASFLRFLFPLSVQSLIAHLQRRLSAATLSDQGPLPSQSATVSVRCGGSSRRPCFLFSPECGCAALECTHRPALPPLPVSDHSRLPPLCVSRILLTFLCLEEANGLCPQSTWTCVVYAFSRGVPLSSSRGFSL